MIASRRPRNVVAGVLFCAALAAWWTGDHSKQELLAEIAILALLAMSLDFIVGFAGLVSLGHALFYGLSAYAIAGLTVHLHWTPMAAIAGAIAAATLTAALTGALIVRLGGVFFIMATLAFGQMAWAYFLRSPTFGGVSGLAGIPLADMSWVGLTLLNPSHMALIAIVMCGFFYLALARLVDSAFGHMLIAIHQNEVRARALGIPVARYKLVSFTLAGGIAAVAGALATQRAQFVSPDLVVWTVSGEALIIVIVGGLGTLVGPIIGTVVWILLRHFLSDVTTYWMFFMGLMFVGVVLFASGGVYGLLMRVVPGRDHA